MELGLVACHVILALNYYNVDKTAASDIWRGLRVELQSDSSSVVDESQMLVLHQFWSKILGSL